MDITKEAFAHDLQHSLDALLSAMAEESEIAPQQFYNMACILENLAFFSPVIYDALRMQKKQ